MRPGHAYAGLTRTYGCPDPRASSGRCASFAWQMNTRPPDAAYGLAFRDRAEEFREGLKQFLSQDQAEIAGAAKLRHRTAALEA